MLWLLPWHLALASAFCNIDPNNSFPSQGLRLRLMKRSWVTHQLVTEVAAVLLREALNYDVEVVEPENGPVQDMEMIREGHYDANFEVWPQGKWAVMANFTSDGGLVAGGHAVSSRSGLYTMKHTVEKWPQAEFYQHLRSPSIYGSPNVKGQVAADPTKLCETAAWNCSDFTWRPPLCRQNASACWGQVLHDKVSYAQGQIEQQIANHELGLEVTYLTSESLAYEIWDAFATRQNLLFYSWQPGEGWAGIAAENFVPVQFPPKGCNATSTSDPTGPLSCDVEATALLKVVSPALAASPDALRFASVFSLNEADYEDLLATSRFYKGQVAPAACAWLHRIGKERWGAWIHFSNRIKLVNSFPPTHGCFPVMYAFLLLGSVVFLATRACTMAMHWRRDQRHKTKEEMLSSDLEHLQHQMHSRACKTHVDLTSKLVGCSKKNYVAVKWALLKGRMNFMSFFRSEEDFCQPLGAALAPPDASSELRQFYRTKLETIVYIVTSGFARTLLSAFVYTCAAGGVGALLAEVNKTVQLNQRVDPWVQAEARYMEFLTSMRTVSVIIEGFDFLPVFLITYMVGQDVNRWHEWLQCMLKLQGRTHDMILIVNSSYRKVNDPVHGTEQRKAIFKWYRYFNAIHYLAYLNLVPSIGTSEQALTDLQTVGLLTMEECQRLRFASMKVRDTLTSWLGRLWHEELEAGRVQVEETDVFMRQFCALRAILAGLNDMPCKAPPQMVRLRMVIVTNTLLVLALLGYPAKMYGNSNACIQFWPLLSCYLYFICYRGMLHVMFTLDKGPFYAKGECVNVDALLISTERFAFHVFRSPFEGRRSPRSCEVGRL